MILFNVLLNRFKTVKITVRTKQIIRHYLDTKTSIVENMSTKTRPKVYITRAINQEALDILQEA